MDYKKLSKITDANTTDVRFKGDDVGEEYYWKSGKPSIYYTKGLEQDKVLNEIKDKILDFGKVLVYEYPFEGGRSHRNISFSLERKNNKPALIRVMVSVSKKAIITPILKPFIDYLSQYYEVSLKKAPYWEWYIVLGGTEAPLVKEPKSLIKINSIEDIEKNWDAIFDEDPAQFLLTNDENVADAILEYIERSYDDIGETVRFSFKKYKDDSNYSIATVKY